MWILAYLATCLSCEAEPAPAPWRHGFGVLLSLLVVAWYLLAVAKAPWSAPLLVAAADATAETSSSPEAFPAIKANNHHVFLPLLPHDSRSTIDDLA